MHITRMFGVAGVLAASGLMVGCCGDSCWRGGNSRSTLPPQTSSTGTAGSSAGWSNPPRAQNPSVFSPTQTQTQTPAAGMGTSGTGATSQNTSGLTPAGGASQDPTPAATNAVRTVNHSTVSPDSAKGITTAPPQMDALPPPDNAVSPPSPPTLPPPPTSLPPAGSTSSSKSNYTPQTRDLPPEVVPELKTNKLPPAPQLVQ